MKIAITVTLFLALTACTSQQSSNNNQPAKPLVANANQPAQPQTASQPTGALKEGEASGTIVDEGQTINVKYAYAGHAEMFGEDAIVVLVTENPVAPDALAKAFEEKCGIFP